VSVHGVNPSFERAPSRQAAMVAGRLADRTIAISRFVADHQIRLGLAGAGTTTVIPYGIDVTWWEQPTPVATRRASFGFDADDVVVGIASRLIPGKGHDVLLAAMARAIPRAPQLRLAVAGDGPLLDDVRRAAATLPAGGGHLGGFEEDMRGFLQACDVVVFPTLPELGEGFGLAALEAMATGRPVVASEVAALPEVVGDTGVLVPPGSATALADALVALAGEPARRRELGETGRLRAREAFPFHRMVEATIDVYRQVASRA
jgi:glycosyltransferase involved in cell wall biosynthesis